MAAAKRTGTSQTIGYIRVSSVCQNTERQLADVQLDRTFTDKASGSTTDRPQLDAMLATVRAGDTVVVHSIDRLARNLADLLRLVEQFGERGVTLQFLKQGLSFGGKSGPIQKMQLAMLGAVAEFERDLIRERSAEGIAAAQARGVHCGRAPSLTPKQVKQALRWRAAGKSVAAISIDLDTSRGTIYRALQQAGE